MMRRMNIVTCCFLLCAVGLCSLSAPASPPNPDFKVLYHNDFWNVRWLPPYTYTSGNAPSTEIGNLVKRSVDEADVDVHIFYAGNVWVPLWDSQVYSMAEHKTWLAAKKPGQELSVFQQYVYDGGDPVADFVSQCRQKGVSPVIGLPLNHNPGDDGYWEITGSFYEDNPQYWFAKIANGTKDTQSFSFPEVRQYRLDLIQELCENYDIDGIFLDIMRFPAYFNNYAGEGLPPVLTIAERKAIMTGFIADIRTILDAASPGRRLQLGVRIPHLTQAFLDIGIDLLAWQAAGLDYAVVASYYEHNQQTDFTQMQALAPTLSLYDEATYMNSRGESDSPSIDEFRHCTAPLQHYTTAHLAMSRGAKGILLYNFPWNRAFQKLIPPFYVLGNLSNRDFLARQPQWYFLDYVARHYQGIDQSEGGTRPNWPVGYVPFTLGLNQSKTLSLELAPTQYHTQDGLLRIMVDSREVNDPNWLVTMNGQTLTAAPFVDKPFDHPYLADMNYPQDTFAPDPNGVNGWNPESYWLTYKCPRDYVFEGVNSLYIKNIGEPSPNPQIMYLDLTFPAEPVSTDPAERAVDHPGLAVWLDASYGVNTDENGRVIEWKDRATYYNNYTNFAQAYTAARRPLLASGAINGRDAILFEGAQELRIYSTSPRRDVQLGLDDMTVFIVFNIPDPYDIQRSIFSCSNNRPWYEPYIGYGFYTAGLGDGAGRVRAQVSSGGSGVDAYVRNAAGANVFGQGAQIFEIQFQRDKYLTLYDAQGKYDPADIWLKKFEFLDVIANPPHGYEFHIGSNRNAPQYFKGHVAEILMYKGMLHNHERSRIRDYLTYKYTGTPPTQCGDPWTQYWPMDFNENCYVDFEDFAELAKRWLSCTDPANSACNAIY